MTMKVLSRQRGVSLIEVLVAVLIFSLGLIGMAGLMLMSMRSNQSAYLRTQVTFLANNMADRMRANPAGVWQNDYNVTAAQLTAAAAKDCTNASCSPADLATHDLGMWNAQLNTFLPAGWQGSITCDASTAGYTPSSGQVSMTPPYGGICKMELSWYERDVAQSNASTTNSDPNAVVGHANGTQMQQFYWNFTP
jgi:type IV pilus assembly protein PilV